MPSKPYREVIQEIITLLGGKATVFEIYDFFEKNYRDFLREKKTTTWKNTVRYNLCRGNFHQIEKDSTVSLSGRGRGGCKYWYNSSAKIVKTHEEILQNKFEESLKFINSNKEYQEIMLDYYLEF